MTRRLLTALGLTLGGWCAATSMGMAQVVLNEIMYHPAEEDWPLEFIELVNAGEATVDLSGWSLSAGVAFRFPPGTALAPGEMLTVAEEPVLLEASAQIRGVLGPWSGGLGNGGDRVALSDAEGQAVDEVMCDDRGSWPEDADGAGASLELIHPRMDNALAQAWHASTVLGGTPGRPNSVAADRPAPLIVGVTFEPLVPQSNESITVTVQLVAAPPPDSVALRWRPDGEDDFREPALEGGEAGLLSGLIPPQSDGTTVELFAEVRSEGEVVSVFPRSAPEANLLFQVDDTEHSDDLPLLRVVMTQRDWDELWSRNIFSNVLVNATFVADGRAWHGVGIRFRGKNSRTFERKSYRIEFGESGFDGVHELNLNGTFTELQLVTTDLFQRAGLPSPRMRMVALILRGEAPLTYLQVESYDDTFLPHWYGPDAGGGNLYRGEEQANLDFRGHDFDAYRPHYLKQTNAADDDFSDIVALCDAFTNLSDEEFADRIGAFIDVDQWLRFLAVNTLAVNREGSIYNLKGDDYFLYHNPATGLFEILPWDLDACLVDPTESILAPAVPAIARLIRHPAFSGRYHRHVRDLMETEFAIETMLERLDALGAAHGEPIFVDHIPWFLLHRHQNLAPQLPAALRVSARATSRHEALGPHAQWWSLAGTSEPTMPGPHLPALPWYHPDFRFFEAGFRLAGPPMGFGLTGSRTDLSAMRGVHTSHFLRRNFDVPHPRAVTALRLALSFEGGVVAHLNGHEVLRRNVAGVPGTPVPHDAVATIPHVTPPPVEFFDLSGHLDLLNAGPNTLAIHGLTTGLNASAFLLAPSLEIAMLPAGQFLTEAVDSLTLSGLTSLFETHAVRVNGDRAALSIPTGRWEHTAALTPGVNTLHVTSHGADGDILEEVMLDVIAAPSPREVGGILMDNREWRAQGGPIRITSDVVIPDGVALWIGPGTLIGLDPGVGITVQGSLRVRGDPDSPVVFTSAVPGERWGGITLDHADTATEIEGCRIDWGTVEAHGGSLVMRDCSVRYANSFRTWNVSHVLLTDDCAVRLERCTFEDNEATSLFQRPPSLVIRDCTYLRTRGDHDAIDIDAANEHGAVPAAGEYLIENTVIDGVGDDGIDWFGLDLTVRGCEIRGAVDKGISVDHASQSVIEDTLISGCADALVAKLGAQVTLERVTVEDCTRGLTARDEASVTVQSCSIMGEAVPERTLAEETLGSGGD